MIIHQFISFQLISIILLFLNFSVLMSSERGSPSTFPSFEEALLPSIVQKIQLSLILQTPLEVVDERPSYMTPFIDAIYLVVGQKSRMSLILVNPPHSFAVNGKPAVFIGPFDDFTYVVKVDPVTTLGQRICQFLQKSKVNTQNMPIVRQIVSALSTGPKDKLSQIVNQINLDDVAEIEKFRRKR
jgi:hypothetical protein